MPIEIVDLVPGLAVVVRKIRPMAELREAQREARQILDVVLRNVASPTGPRLTVWRTPRNGAIDYAPGIIVSEPVPLEGEASLFPLPQGRAALLRLRGGYDKLPGAWSELFAACHEGGIALAGLNWEIYGPPDAAGADLYALLA